MIRKCVLFIIAVSCIALFSSCTSDSYKIDAPNAKDTAKVKVNTQIDSAALNKMLRTKKTYIVKSAATFILSVSGQFNIGVSELSTVDNPQQYEEGQSFGVQNGWGVTAFGKIPLDRKKGNVRILILGSYNYFKSSFTNQAGPTNGTIKYGIVSGGLGLENNFTPTFPVKPYIGAVLMGSMIYGSSVFDSAYAPLFSTTIKGSFRLGYSLYAGIEYAVSNYVGFNLGAKITSCNTWLKSSKDNGSETELNLRDAFTSPHIPYGGWKNFAFTSFFLGASFYFGVQDRLYKF